MNDDGPGYWNYRVLCRSFPIADTGDFEESYEIIEVYYDADGTINGWGESRGPVGETLEKLWEETLRFLEVITSASSPLESLRVLTTDDVGGE